MIAALFVNPVNLSPTSQLWLMLPLFLSAAIVHKTIRTGNLRRLWRDVAFLFTVYMIGGTIVLALVLWLVMTHWPSR